MIHLFYLVLVAFLFSGCEPYTKTANIVYDPNNGVFGMYDMYEPATDDRDNRPALLAIHGGGWESGDKNWGEDIAEEFSTEGYVVFSVNYRLSIASGGVWPAQIQDVEAALRHIRANAAKYRINPEKIASIGVSAGGHLATMVGLRDDAHGPEGRVKVVVDLDGEHDMTLPGDHCMSNFDHLMSQVLGHVAPWADAELRDISTISFARSDVSVMIVHGASDPNVYVENADRLSAVLKDKGAEVEYVRIEGKEGNCHGRCWKVPVAREAIHRFLNRHLVLAP